MEKEASRSKAPKGKLGKSLEQTKHRHRNYGYRGMGRDDGDEEEEMSWNRNRDRRNSGYSGRKSSNYERNSRTDIYGFER